MLCGYLPFDDENKQALYDKILACKFKIPPEVSLEAADLIRRLLVKDVNKRLQVEEILKHPWVRKHEQIHIDAVEHFTIGSI